MKEEISEVEREVLGAEMTEVQAEARADLGAQAELAEEVMEEAQAEISGKEVTDLVVGIKNYFRIK